MHRSLIKQDKKEGKLEGIIQGKEEVPKNMLANNFSTDDVAKNTSLTEERVKEIELDLALSRTSEEV